MDARVKPMIEEGAYLRKMERKGLTPDGSALDAPDMDVPIAPPLGYVKQPSITERIRDMVRSEHLRLAAESAGAETFEESEDFDVGDDYEPSSPYEEVFEPDVPAPLVESTGVPPSSGGGEGAGGDVAEAPTPGEPQKGAAEPSPVPAAPKPSKAPPGPT